jgi:DNA repair exonuclease SbcCD ATPase subunit
MIDSTDMLELLELRMRNFLSYGNNYTIIDLTTPGTTLIVGEDLDSGTGSANGVGKTTILNGIVYGLYDKPLSKEIKLDHLINNINKKNMEVSLTFRKHGDTFVVTRFRKGKDGNTVILTKNGTAITRDSVDQTNKFIETVIGYSYDLFVRIVVFSAGHDAFLDLPTSGAKKPLQSDIMEELFDLTSLTEKAERAKKEIKANEQRMEVIKAQIEQIEREAERHAAQIATTRRLIGEWDVTQTGKIARLKAELATLEGIDFEKEQRLHKELEAKKPARKALWDARDRAVTWEASHQMKTLRVMKDLKKLDGIDFDAQLELHRQLKHATQRHKELASTFKQYSSFEETNSLKLSSLAKEIQSMADVDFDAEKAIFTHLADKQASLKTLNTELEEIVRVKGENLVTYEKLNTESKHLFDATCPYCLQNFAGAKEKGEKIGDQLTELQGGLKKHDSKITKTNKAISALAEEIEALKGKAIVKSLADLVKMQSDKESLDCRYADASDAVNPHAVALQELMQSDKIESDQVELDIAELATKIKARKDCITVDDADELAQMKSDSVSLKARLEELTEEANPYLKEINALGVKIKATDDILEVCDPIINRLTSEIKDIEDQITVDDIEDLLETKNNSATMEARIKEMSTEANPYETTLAELEAVELDEAKYDFINEMTKVVDHHKFLVKLLTKSDSFVRKQLIAENIPFLNKQLRENLKDLGLPHRVEFTDTMSASISQLGRPLEFGNLSRGQKARVNLALAWAFHDVLQSMHGPVNFCLLDEVLDVGLCSVGVIMAAKMLKNRAKRDKLTMFIISHKQEVDSIFDRTMKIQLHKGFSKIATE